MNFDSRIDKVTINTGDREIPTLDLGANEDLTIRIWLDVDGNIEHLSPQWGYFGQVNVDVIQPVVITNTTTESYRTCVIVRKKHKDISTGHGQVHTSRAVTGQGMNSSSA